MNTLDTQSPEHRVISRTALVTGGSGSVGPALVCKLLDHGYHVRVLLRSDATLDSLPPAVQRYLGDVTDPAVVSAACVGCDVIFHLAALLHINQPSPEQIAAYEQVNVGGTRCIAEAAAREAARVILFSSIAVYGPSLPDTIHDEQTPPQPATPYAQSKLAAERVALDAPHGCAVVLRPAAVYGPRVKGNYASLLTSIRRGRFAPIGSSLNRRTLIHIDDLVSAALLAAEQDHALGQIYNVTDGHIHSLREIVEAMYCACGKQTPPFSIPLSPMRLAVSAVERGSAMLHYRPPITRHLLDKYTEDMAVCGDKIQLELGFQPQVDLLAGWQGTLRLQ